MTKLYMYFFYRPNFDTIEKGFKKGKLLLDLQNDFVSDMYHCVKVFEGFFYDSSWCILMEYYPKNLKTILNERKKGFHIDHFQDLSRQLITAVMILRTRNIIHSGNTSAYVLLIMQFS